MKNLYSDSLMHLLRICNMCKEDLDYSPNYIFKNFFYTNPANRVARYIRFKPDSPYFIFYFSTHLATLPTNDDDDGNKVSKGSLSMAYQNEGFHCQLPKIFLMIWHHYVDKILNRC